jgi:DNA uptake protein ComE-like DNA-binding protein
MFDVIKPFIEIQQDTVIEDYAMNNDYPVVELNSADTLDLQQLKGIGPSFAKRIVKYRDMLGGYYSKSQLLEVYGMDSARYEGFKNFVFVNPDSVKKIDINSATIKQLIKHPYIEFYTAKSIVNYRTKLGKYSEVTQLKDSSLVYDELYRKIAPYLIAK